jgi:hypothetical protein
MRIDNFKVEGKIAYEIDISRILQLIIRRAA